MEEISWNDRVRNEMLRRVKEVRNIVHTVKSWKDTWIVNMLIGTAF